MAAPSRLMVTRTLRLVPLTKAARQARIRALVLSHPVRSQTELAALLVAEGVRVTQATLSRDLEEMGAGKAHGRYTLSEDPSPFPAADPTQRLRRLTQELLLSAEAAGHLVVARTPPGGAQLLASALDKSTLPGLVGCVAGDDTIMLACRTEVDARTIATHLRSLAEGTSSTH